MEGLADVEPQRDCEAVKQTVADTEGVMNALLLRDCVSLEEKEGDGDELEDTHTVFEKNPLVVVQPEAVGEMEGNSVGLPDTVLQDECELVGHIVEETEAELQALLLRDCVPLEVYEEEEELL